MKRSIITTFLAGTPSSTYSVATGYSVSSEWINTNNGNRFYHKTDGNWIPLNVESPFYIQGGTSSAFDTTSSVYRTGNIGIGTATPSTTLHIFATQSGAFRLVDGTQGPGYLLASDINGVATWTASTYAPDSNVVHRTGNENISGNKTFENIGFFSNVSVRNYNTGASSTALDSITVNGGIGIKSQNDGTGIGIYSNGTSTGLNYVGANSGVTTFSVNKTGEVYATKIGIGTATPSTTLHIFATQSGAFRLVDTTQGPGKVLISDANGVASWTSSLTGLSLLGNSEVISTEVIATASVVVYDYSLSSLWYHGTASSNFTANFTNLPTTDNRVLSTSIVINQGLNGYIPNEVQIEGVTQSVKWPGGTQSGTSYNLDIVTFNFIRTSGTWTNVIGQVASFT